MGVPATPGLGTVGPMTRVSRALAVTASTLALTLPAGAAPDWAAVASAMAAAVDLPAR